MILKGLKLKLHLKLLELQRQLQICYVNLKYLKKKKTNLQKNKNGKVILVKSTARLNFVSIYQKNLVQLNILKYGVNISTRPEL